MIRPAAEKRATVQSLASSAVTLTAPEEIMEQPAVALCMYETLKS